MTTKEDFVGLFQDASGQLSGLPSSPKLADFNYMITSQRTMEKVAEKLEQIEGGGLTGTEHGNFWVDLRSMGLVNEGEQRLSDLGRAAHEYFKRENDQFKREHFVLSNIRRRSYEIPDLLYEEYQRKLGNLRTYLNTIPQSNQKGAEILLNQDKVFFTECLNLFPSAVIRYFQLPPQRQAALDGLHESGLDSLFNKGNPQESDYYKLAHKFANECRAFERRTNFINSTILSEYEEAVERVPDNKIEYGIFDDFGKILTNEILVELIGKSDLIDLWAIGKQIVQRAIDDKPLPLPSEAEIQAAIAEIRKTLLIDDKVVRQIVANLVAGKHILLAGPIATGKTELARKVSELIWKNQGNGYYSEVATATSEWTTQNVIGGIYPKIDEKGGITYVVQRGWVTETVWKNWTKVGSNVHRTRYNRGDSEFRGVWLVIDEFNRANIDSAFGELFTALEYKRLKFPTVSRKLTFEEIQIPEDYRIIATLNTFDKHFLFKMSDALKRRFAYIELLPPSPAKAEEEKYYVVSRGLENLSFVPELKSKIVLDESTHSIVRGSSDPQFLASLDAAHGMFSFIRRSKNLGTGVLTAVFRLVFVGSSMGVGVDESLDDGLVSNVIPQLENLPKWSLECIKAFCCDDIATFLKGKKSEQVEFPNYQQEFRKLLSFLEKDNISTKLDRYYKGEIVENNEWSGYNPWTGKTRPPLPLFRRALEDLIQESETL